jgi:nucleotide-binding universal stress UspA family protein
MKRILVPCDGSNPSLAAVRFALELASLQPGSRIHLLNVQPPVSGAAATFLGKAPIRHYHEEEGNKALAPAKALVEASAVPFEHHIAAGDPGETIAAYAEQNNIDHIAMGTRGLGTLPGLLLGSVANAVLRLTKQPVTLLR